MKRALIVQGGWNGHEPVLVSKRFQRLLEANGFEAEISDTLDAFLDVEELKKLDLICPVWTMGSITAEQRRPVIEAVASGVGLAGCHGGMCDSFRLDVDWQFMTGAQWVAHPGGEVPYRVNIKKNTSSPIVEGLEDFDVFSEQYYVHVDPAINVLATTRFPTYKYYHSTNGEVDVPITYTKTWGYGRVFYTTLGHHDDIFNIPAAEAMMLRGMLWAAESKEIAVARGLDYHTLLQED